MKTLFDVVRYVCICAIAAWCAGIACTAQSCEPGEPPKGRLSALAYAKLARSLARAPAVPVDRELALSDLLAAQLTITRQDAEMPEEAESEFILWRRGDRFESAGGPVPLELIDAVARLPASAVPELGMERCGENGGQAPATAPVYLSVDLTLLADGRRPVRLRSDSRCQHLLPWHMTDGRSLAVLTQPAAGEALLALVQALCAQCLPPLPQPSYVPRVKAPGKADFATHYTTLLTQWRRLGRDHGATEILLQTQPLTDALEWMDHAGFERLLRATGRDSGGSAGILARQTLRILQIARWGYIDRSGKWVLPRRFEQAGVFAAGSALVREDGVWRPIDRSGRVVREVRTGEPYYLPVRLQPSESNGKWGFADASGRMVLSASFDAAASFQEGLAAVQSNGKWGFVDEEGQWAIKPQFAAARSFSEGLAAVNREGLWGYVDRRGRTVIAPRFVDAGDFGEGLAPVR